jgi:acyl-CoA thioesterase-1
MRCRLGDLVKRNRKAGNFEHGNDSRARRAGALLLLFLGLAANGAAQASAVRTILFFGDSLTAGYGLADPDAQSFPAQIQKRIDAAHMPWHVVNAGLSGETSAGGLRRIDWVLSRKPDVFVLELGANDGLRGTATEATEANLQAIIKRVRLKYPSCRIVLAGMRMPPNMGPDYTEAFQAIFPDLARRNQITLIPFLLEGVAEKPGLNQGDDMHPNASGAALVADTVWLVVYPILALNK